MLEYIVIFFTNLAEGWGYFGVFFLMVVESSAFVPFPSEVVIVPAAFAAYEGNMNVFMVVFMGTLGSLVGALINYYFAMYVGRRVVYKFVRSKFAKWVFLNEEKVKQAEELFRRNGEMTTFVGRLIPGIRQLISVPAGLAKMHLGSFIFYTTLGAGIWVTILAVSGWYLGKHSEVVSVWVHDNWIWALLGLFTLIFAWKFGVGMWRKSLLTKKKADDEKKDLSTKA